MNYTTADFYEKYEAIEADFLQKDRRYRRRQRRRRRNSSSPNPRPSPEMVRADLTDFNDNVADFIPSYAAALDPLHYERQWIINSLSGFYHDNVITDVTRIVKGGKEANVYCCLANPVTGVDLIAAKLYRPRTLRHLKNDALYVEGRNALDKDGKEVFGHREARAMRNKTRFGQHLGLMTWIVHEYQVQSQLYEAGADIPRPIAHRDNTILMAFIGEEWAAAPTLSDVSLDNDEAKWLFEQVMKNIRLMLAHHYVHADLSAYNILYWQGEITIIDFPQMVDARTNPSAAMLFKRDVRRVCQYFNRFGVQVDPAGLARELWQLYMDGLLSS